MFSGVYWNQPACLSVHVYICLQNTSVCQSAGRGIKSHLVTALVSTMVIWESSQYLGKKIVQSTGKRDSRKTWMGALAMEIKHQIFHVMLKTAINTIESIGKLSVCLYIIV